MTTSSIRPAFSSWPHYQRQLRDVLASMTDEQLAVRPSPDRWPLWATIGHLACQRISWLCGFAEEPGADGTPFPDALYSCPGDEYLEPVMTVGELVGALNSTFGVVEAVLDRWTFDQLDEEIRRTSGNEESVHTRGWVIQRVFSHDVYHVAELNEALGAAGLPQIDLWG
jgi:hypothetical protein